MSSPIIFFRERREIVLAELSQVKKKRQWIMLLRICLFLSMLISTYVYFKGQIPTLWPAVAGLFVFLIVVQWDGRVLSFQHFIEKQLFSIDNELGILTGMANRFPNGQSFDGHAEHTADLDIFGQYSLFHLINRCSTQHGAQQLADSFIYPKTNPQLIKSYQEAIKQLSHQPVVREKVMAAGLTGDEKEGNLHDVSSWMAQQTKLEGKTIPQLARVLFPIINLATAYTWLATGNYLLFLLSVAVSWVYLGRLLPYIQQQHQLLGKKTAILKQYAGILKAFSATDTSGSARLQLLKSSSLDAYSSIKQLARLSEAFDQRLNAIIFIVLNTFFLYDLQVILALEKWQNKHRSSFADWLLTVGDIEVINSFAAFAFLYPSYAYPVLHDTYDIEATNLSHPLIAEDERVNNDVVIGKQEKLFLLTGSNMSGKSTFLRSIGINLLLAQSGAPVCASSFVFKPMRLFTCIRVADSLHEHTSYFMAELKKLQQIIHDLKQEEFALVLIDEILRGTNSDDKHFGSVKYIEQLIHFPCLSMFATHDVQLGVMAAEHPGKISNYCFESSIINGELIFDYKLRQGISKNRNASFLMKKMEIIRD